MIGAGKRRRSRRRRERRSLLLFLILMKGLLMMAMLVMMLMLVMMMVMTMIMMMTLLLLLLLDAVVAGRARHDRSDGRKRRYRRSLDPDRMRSTGRATIRQHEALGSSIQRASGVPIAGIGGSEGAFQGSDNATVPGVVAAGDGGGRTIVRPIGRLNRDQGRLGPVLDRGSGPVRARSAG